MAASIDNSTNHERNFTADSHCGCQISNFCRFIRLCTPRVRRIDSSNSIFKDSSKVIPQECSEDDIWQKMQEDAKFYTKQEPILSKYYCSSILSHKSLETALANQLAIKLCKVNLSREALYDVFLRALVEDGNIQRAIVDDLKAVKERDPACISYVHCFLNFKGFLALQAHRIAHKLWINDRTVLAILIQNQVSEVFAVDIHPGAKIGHGIVFDHATGIVIGETAVIGNRVTILHDVTLGGTGKIQGDRHPKIGDGVLIGAGAKILGNVKIGENAKIGAGSLILKEIPAGATAVGNPARVIGLR
ncbi:unnamed protein product [Fraxinus pennsylvanica]|uniref:serine O-acetyltransferase n=1 Tax=Fraxinus pennsylvanica TaxID=56036 RepID=A0AAD1YQ82_9LAMI|nr:unnamed protein product [Fraxinus pennsylvanica]